MAASKVTLKLLIDKNGNKVLFAEAGKDFVDFLFNIMSMPVGTVTWLLTKNSMVGSLGNLYHSIDTLGETYLQENQTKESLLKPNVPSSAINVPFLLPNYGGNKTDCTPGSRMLYCCPNATDEDDPDCRFNVSDDPLAVCPNCGHHMSNELNYIVPPPKDQGVAPVSGGGGFVKGVVTCMVMDDLVVTPMSSISSITLMSKLGVKGIDMLEERVVELGMDEGLKLLKESMQSKTVLTSVFLKN